MLVKIIISAMLATFFSSFSLITMLFVGGEDVFLLTAITWLLFFISVYTWLLIAEHKVKGRFTKAEKAVLHSVPWLSVNGNMENPGYNTNVYFCDDGITFITLDLKPFASFSVPLGDVISFSADDRITLEITVSGNKKYRINIPDAPAILNVIRDHGWRM